MIVNCQVPSLGTKEQPITSQLTQRNSYYSDRVVSGFLGRVGPTAGTSGQMKDWGDQQLKISLRSSSSCRFSPTSRSEWKVCSAHAERHGSENLRRSRKLQDRAASCKSCLKDVMKKTNFRPIKVALVDLTKGLMQPEFAGSFDFKEQVFVASVAKIAAMLAAFQLRQDLRVAWKMKGAKSLAELFDRVRDDWAATQSDPGGKATPFTRRVSPSRQTRTVERRTGSAQRSKISTVEKYFQANPGSWTDRIRQYRGKTRLNCRPSSMSSLKRR